MVFCGYPAVGAAGGGWADAGPFTVLPMEAPQWTQNFSFPETGFWHTGQAPEPGALSWAPHLLQNFEPAFNVLPQLLQNGISVWC
jgi:hypothetical protein